MSVDRPPKRKRFAKRDAVSPQTPPKKKRPKSRTADNLEALLHLLDEDDTSAAAVAAGGAPGKTTSGQTQRPAREKYPVAGEASSFMQELARARAELHQERRARIALQEEVESLRAEQTRLATTGTAKVNELRRESEDLQKQLAALEKQRQQLKEALLDAESELDAERMQRDRLHDQVDALTKRIADAETMVRERDELIQQARAAADDSARGAREWEERFCNEHATRAQVEQQLTEQASQLNDALAARETRSEALQREVDDFREQLASASSDLEAAESARTQLEQVVERVQRDYQQALARSREMSDASETERNEMTALLGSLETQIANANDRLAESSADQQQLRVALTDATDEKRRTAVSLDAATAANERLERRVYELETELTASNQLRAKSQGDAAGVHERCERLQAETAKVRVDLAESYEQLGTVRIRLANAERDRDHAQQREAEAVRRTDELPDEVKSLQAAVQREAAGRRKAEAVHKREAEHDAASALFEAEQKIERLSRELAASKGVAAAYQQKAARKVQQVKQELETLRQRLAEIEQGPGAS